MNEKYHIALKTFHYPKSQLCSGRNFNANKVPGELLLDAEFKPGVLRRRIEDLAIYFRREFEYDFRQYCANEIDSPDKSQCFGWYYPYGFSIFLFGAASFRFRTYSDANSSRWALQWAWFHPFERHKGHFKKAFLFFKERFGEFDIEPPYSQTMKHFIRKYIPWITV